MNVKYGLRQFLDKTHKFFRPRDEFYFHHFDMLAQCGRHTAFLLRQLLRKSTYARAIHQEMKEIEKRADGISAAIYDHLLCAKFPIPDPDEIKFLTRRLDDVVDNIESVGHRMMLVAEINCGSLDIFGTLFPIIRRQARVLSAATRELERAVYHLHRLEWITDIHRRIHALENHGDMLWEGEGGILQNYFSWIMHGFDKPLMRSDLFFFEARLMAHTIEDCTDIIKNTVDALHDVTEKHREFEHDYLGFNGTRPKRASIGHYHTVIGDE